MTVTLGIDAPTIYISDSHSSWYPFAKVADSGVDMLQGFNSIYVYIDVVEPHVVGDSLVSLLRIVPIQGEQTISKHFNHVPYFPLLRKEFGTIEIIIRDDTGHAVPFERGEVT